MSPNIRTIHGDENRDIAKDGDAPLIGIRLQRSPLLEKFELIESVRQTCFGHIRALYQCPMLSVSSWPFLPGSMTKLTLYCHKQRVRFQPIGIALLKLMKAILRLPFFYRQKLGGRFSENIPTLLPLGAEIDVIGW